MSTCRTNLTMSSLVCSSSGLRLLLLNYVECVIFIFLTCATLETFKSFKLWKTCTNLPAKVPIADVLSVTWPRQSLWPSHRGLSELRSHDMSAPSDFLQRQERIPSSWADQKPKCSCHQQKLSWDVGTVPHDRGRWRWSSREDAPQTVNWRLVFFSQPWFHAGTGKWVKPWACESDLKNIGAPVCGPQTGRTRGTTQIYMIDTFKVIYTHHWSTATVWTIMTWQKQATSARGSDGRDSA